MDDDNSHNLRFIHDCFKKKLGGGFGGGYYPNCKQQEPKNERKGQVPIFYGINLVGIQSHMVSWINR